MHVDLRTLQFIALVSLFALIYAGRLIKGSVRQTAEGTAFPMKPAVTFTRLIAMPVYFAIFAYPAWQQHRLPIWLPILLVVVLLYIIYQSPATIILTPTAVEQHFWLRPTKKIAYNEVMAIYLSGAGRITRVMGDNRVIIVHTWNHVAAEVFRTEIERRTGKRIVV